MRSLSWDVTLAVPISIYRYTCRESAEMISVFSISASSMAKADFPVAVDPSMVISGIIECV